MEKFRINNDLSIFWSITEKDGSPYTLSDKTVRLFVTSPRGRMDVTSDITVQDNVICWLFRGSRQRYLGTYKITVEIQASPADRTIRKDIPEAFELVSSTQYEQTEIGRPEINEEGELTLATSLDIFQIKPIIPQVGPNRNWWVDGSDTGKSSVGLTAYEFAKEQGYQGTEAEYAAECLAVATLNEESRTATAAANEATQKSVEQHDYMSSYMEDEVIPNTIRANEAALAAELSTQKADTATSNANEAADRAGEAIESFGPTLAGKADLENGKIKTSQLPDYLLGQVMYGGLIYSDGTINTSANFRAKYGNVTSIVSADALKYKGSYFIVAGEAINATIIGVREVSTGDWIISTYDSWAKIDNSDAVTSVAGLVGNVNASALATVLADMNNANALARKSDLHNPYDDTAIKKSITDLQAKDKTTDAQLAEQGSKLTELSEENAQLRERIAEQDQFIEDLQNTKIDRENDDYYPKMAVGTADNLAGVDVVDSEFNFRRSGGGAITDGVARIETIKGNSVVWNQQYPTGWSKTAEGITSTSVNGKISAVGTTTTSYFRLEIFSSNIANHKYLFTLSGASSALEGKTFSLLNRGGESFSLVTNGFACLFYLNNATEAQRNIGIKNLQEGITLNENLVVNQHDLTQMFGAGNEPTTIEEFYQRIPMGVDMNAYNEGEIIHMDVQSIESVGVNQWDEEWELGGISGSGADLSLGDRIRSSYIGVLPNTEYNITLPSGQNATLFFFDNEKQVLSSAVYRNVFSTPANCRYVRFVYGSSANVVTTYNHDICINISDTSINGKYFPYIKRVEDLSVIRKYFPDGMKSAGSAHDEIRYNKASGKWEKVVRIGEVDLGALSWRLDSSGFFYGHIDGMAKPSAVVLSAIYSQYSKSISLSGYDSAPDKSISTSGSSASSYVYIKDTSNTDLASFKAAVNGVTLYYELAEPIVTELDEADQFKDLDYQVWNCGTEKALAEGKSSALAADITYGFNAVGLLKQIKAALQAAGIMA